MSIELVRTAAGHLAPVGEDGRARIGKLAPGEIVLADVRRPRNLGHHRKAMALFRFAFDRWEPGEAEIGGERARKSFDVFRRELVIAAGYYEVVLGLDGAPRLEALSLRFDAMDQETFTEVYEAVVSVLTGGILHGMTKDEAQRLADAVFKEGF